MQVFNGGSDFNEPIKRCLDRLHTAAWANSDILLVSDGELRQPGIEIMRKLAGKTVTLAFPCTFRDIHCSEAAPCLSLCPVCS